MASRPALHLLQTVSPGRRMDELRSSRHLGALKKRSRDREPAPEMNVRREGWFLTSSVPRADGQFGPAGCRLRAPEARLTHGRIENSYAVLAKAANPGEQRGDTAEPFDAARDRPVCPLRPGRFPDLSGQQAWKNMSRYSRPEPLR